MTFNPAPLRLVLVCPYPILPAITGGKIRIVKLARQLARLGVDVTAVTPYHPRQKQELVKREPFRIVQAAYPFLLPLFFSDRPLPYQYWTSFHPGLGALLRCHFKAADIIQFEHSQFAKLALQLPPRQIVVYGSHNIEYDYAQAECRSAWAAALVGRRIAKLEGRLIARSQHVFAVSKEDCQRFNDLYGASPERMTVAINGIDSAVHQALENQHAIARFPRLAPFGRRGLYSGSDVEHNRLAVRFILTQVAPRRPDVGFVIHGGCGNSFAAACRLANVFFDPIMDHFDDYTSAGFYGLNSVTTGSGSNLKLLQYFSRGMPVISTPFGLRGYAEFSPYATVCEPDRLWQAFDNAPSPAAPASLLRNYEWQTVAIRMLNVYRRLVTQREQAGSR